ncbi:hypothetical protein [Kitasatospora sp. NPDC088134]|uniref:hypothetical protein n=1 Tax=Kitasatospora sp. NPDC088134 TaxID=3364071 RepID=UPI0037F99056
MDTYTGHLADPAALADLADPTVLRPGDPLPADRAGLLAAEPAEPAGGRWIEDGVCDYEDVILRSVN